MARILVVDDFPDVLDCMRTMLTLFGHEVDVAESGPEALDKLAFQEYQILISDISMPEMNGFKLLKLLRDSTSQNKDIYAIALTGYSREVLAAESNTDGFQKLVMKTNNESLLREIDNALARKLSISASFDQHSELSDGPTSTMVDVTK
jgi:two-component system, chemotaxis family, CheB/CheR fusion protein